MEAHLNPRVFDQYINCGRSIVVAVSGGGDSLALLDLYRSAKTKTPQLPSPFVVSVDHGLRAGFADEATLVESYCLKHDLPWQLVCWVGDKPSTGIMAAARMARYRLLADAAQNAGASIILTGHTLDDQKETLAMRANRGEPSAMESDVLFERRAWISRPLLAVSRADLRMYLVQNHIVFADDPTNADMRFERARVRKENSEAISILAKQISREHLAVRAAEFLLQNVRCENSSIVILKPAQRAPDAELFAFRYLAAMLGGFVYPATLTIGEQIVNLLKDGNNGVAFTAQRCCFIRFKDGIIVTPDPRHNVLHWLQPYVPPFETFCAKSLLPLANALAQIVGAQQFLCPIEAAI